MALTLVLGASDLWACALESGRVDVLTPDFEDMFEYVIRSTYF